jgi:glutaredoxin
MFTNREGHHDTIFSEYDPRMSSYRSQDSRFDVASLLKLIPLAYLAFVLGVAFLPTSSLSSELELKPDLEVFVREDCPHCTAAKAFLGDLKKQRPLLKMSLRDVQREPSALARLNALASRLNVHPVGVPAFYVAEELIVGYRDAATTGARIIRLLDQHRVREPRSIPSDACRPARPCDDPPAGVSPAADERIEIPWIGPLNVRDIGLPMFTVLIGLLDGFNPCAMWVLLFLLSLLVTLRDRVRMAAVAGTFVLISGVVYFAFMAAWLNVFLIIGFSRTIQVLLGCIALVIGTVHIKDFFAFGSGISLSIPESAKPGLYAKMRGVLNARSWAEILLGVATLALLVNAVELLCTAGLPALYTHVLTLQGLSGSEYYAYLVLYNLAYILDDGLMVAIAVLTLSRYKLQEREGRWLKLGGGAVMAALGLILLVRPGLLY